MRPGACTASQWTSAPAARARAAISATGWIAPVSLLASMTETSASGPCAARAPSRRRHVDPAFRVDGQEDQRLRASLGGAQDGGMLDGAGDDRRPAGALERGVVRLGAAGREDQRRRCAIDQRGDALAGVLDALACGPPEAVDRRWIARRAQRLGHRLRYGGFDRRRGVVVEIDRRVVAHPAARRARSPRRAARASPRRQPSRSRRKPGLRLFPVPPSASAARRRPPPGARRRARSGPRCPATACRRRRSAARASSPPAAGRAGIPTMVAPGGTSFRTTALAPMPRVAAHRDRTEHLGTGADHHAVLDGRMALAGRPGHAAQRHAVIERHVVADDGGLSDHHAHAVVDEEPAADADSGMDLDPGDHPADMGDEAAEKPEAASPEPVCHVVEEERVEARIAEEDLDPGADGRIPAEHAARVFPNALEHDAPVRIPMARARAAREPCPRAGIPVDIGFPARPVKVPASARRRGLGRSPSVFNGMGRRERTIRRCRK